MGKRITILTLLCVAMLIPSVANAQEFRVFAREKVVVANVRDASGKLDDGLKIAIRQGIIEACINSDDYEVFEINIDDIQRQLKTNGQEVSFANICKSIGERAEYIIFTDFRLNTSDIRAKDITIYISSALYRIATASEERAHIEEAKATSQSIIQATSLIVSKLLGIQNSHNQTSAEDLYNKGLELYKDKDYSKAIAYFKQAAEQGYAKAQNHLGFCYEKGQGIAQDYYEAVKWYRKAAEQGYAKAQTNLGLCYAKGQGVAQDYYEAAKWYRKAAEQGYAKAQTNLGFCYAKGQGVAQDSYEAVKWYRKAAEQGFASAQFNLGLRYAEGRGVAQDYYEAAKWYRKAAEQGHTKAKAALERLKGYY